MSDQVTTRLLRGLDGSGREDILSLQKALWDKGVSEGDARFCVLSRAIELVENEFYEEGGVPFDRLAAVNTALGEQLPGILESPSLREGSRLAETLRADIRRALVGDR